RPMPSTIFYFDLGSPFAYLAAERLADVLSGPIDWQPISLGGIFKLTGRSSWGLSDPERRRTGMAEVERRARAYELPPIRWPHPWPGHSLRGLPAATLARRAGLAREFALRAFRIAFAEGRDLSLLDPVLDAARAVGLDPQATEQATHDPELKRELREATEHAH